MEYKNIITEAEQFIGSKFSDRKCRAFFGCGITSIQTILVYLINKNGFLYSIKHLLWTLHFLKANPKNDVNQLPVTWKTWLPIVKSCISELYSCLPDYPLDEYTAKGIEGPVGVIDVTRTKINSPQYLEWQYYSSKDGFHALKTEVVVSLKVPHRIIWVATGYKGAVSDITIAREGFIYRLRVGQYVLGDKGYYGEDSAIVTPFRGKDVTKEEKDFNFRLNKHRQIIERVNKRLKIFDIVSEWKRLDYDFHNICVHVVSKLTNLIFDENPL